MSQSLDSIISNIKNEIVLITNYLNFLKKNITESNLESFINQFNSLIINYKTIYKSYYNEIMNNPSSISNTTRDSINSLNLELTNIIKEIQNFFNNLNPLNENITKINNEAIISINNANKSLMESKNKLNEIKSKIEVYEENSENKVYKEYIIYRILLISTIVFVFFTITSFAFIPQNLNMTGGGKINYSIYFSLFLLIIFFIFLYIFYIKLK